MVALVQLPTRCRGRRVDRIELQRADATVAQALEELLRRAERTHAVVDQVHLHACALLCDQCVREAPADRVVLKDVRLHVDVVNRGCDGHEHGTVRIRPVLEQPDTIATDEGRSGHGLLDCEVPIEDSRVVGAALESDEDLATARGRERPAGTFDLRRGRRERCVRRDLGQGAAGRERQQQQYRGQMHEAHTGDRDPRQRRRRYGCAHTTHNAGRTRGGTISAVANRPFRQSA